MEHRTQDLRLKTLNSRLLRLLLSCILSIILLPVNGEAAVKRQKVTVGMYNTYSTGDGNLGRAEPDLKEVWEGAPQVSDFEACNVTMHYWPRPEDLPDVEADENAYSAWWKAYMEEAYNLTNQDGEVSLRVIVGPLYSYYAAYKGTVFNGFIEDLCRWEKDSIYEGTLAGWYLTEEPMGSTHNYDYGICNEMAEAIKSVEDSVKIGRHKMYIDVAIGGKYYSPAAFAAFTRPVDVVMLSANTFLWTTSGQQPVYEPDWDRIHWATSQARGIIYPDRDRRKMPHPEIHVILEARDVMGHGQPTNWETRQQIHLALSQSFLHNDDPPADGIWFFWWTEIGRNKTEDTDDWNYGRRIAEAIQTQVARSTFAESPSQNKGSDPDETRFRFPEFGSFNPTNSCIPYDLAEPGYVRVQILNENMSLVKDFDMKYQVAGNLRRFGGPYWRKESASSGFYVFRLYLNSELMDEVKAKVQWSITVNSTSHQPGVWSSSNMVEVQWEPQAEDIEGLDGYSILWDTSGYSYPDTQQDLTSFITSLRSDLLPDGDSNYFHIRSVNGAGKWGTPAHLGPFCIDTTEPGSVRDLASGSHEPGEWSKDKRINVYWNPAEDATSGISGYSILWDGAPGTLPDDEVDISDDTTLLASEPLADGEYYFHIRSVDRTGNWSHTAAHVGPFLIDTAPPEAVTDLLSDSHVPGRWSNDDTINVSWKAGKDPVSGIAGYSALWDDSPDTQPGDLVNMDSRTYAVSPALESSENQGYYFHICSIDEAGNRSAPAHLGPFYIDTSKPGNAKNLTSDSHVTGEWSRDNVVNVSWDAAGDVPSGIDGYSVLWDDAPGTLPDDEMDISGDVTVLASEPVDDGRYYFHIRSVDNAGNWNHTAAHLGPFQIDMSPPENVTDLMSSTHVPGEWSNIDNIVVNWTAAEDSTSGIGGYSVLWDDSASTLPGESINTDNETSAVSYTLQSSADAYYFHIRSVDEAGNWASGARHLGPFMIDAEPPPAVEALVSMSHEPDQWSSQTSVDIAWNPVEDDISGTAGYEWGYTDDADRMSALPAPPLHIPHLRDGVWDVYVRAVDNAGNTGDSAVVTVKIDSELPAIKTIVSPSHPDDNVWYIAPEVALEWASSDKTSGIDGYSWSWDTEPGTTPDTVKEDAETRGRFLAASADAWYFHLRAVDKAGNWSDPSHYKVQVDPSAPPAPQIGSDTHRDGEWIAKSDVRLTWDTPVPGPSGVIGYSYILDHNPLSMPDDVADAGDGLYRDLPDGVWYFHCRAKGGSGLWGPAAHYEIRIDTVPPRIFISHPQDHKWYTEPIMEYSGTADDDTSGIDRSSFEYSYNNGLWIPLQSDAAENWSDRDEIPHCDEAEGDTLQVRVRDKAGNLAVSDLITIMVDRSTSPPVVVSSTHPDQDKWYIANAPDFAWDFNDSISGADGYSWAIDHSETTVPPQIRMIEGHITFKTDTESLSDGVWYFHLRGKDKAGNWSEPAHYRVKIDSTPPTARLKISGPAVVDRDPPLVRAGPVEVLLQTSEAVFDPVLEYRPGSATSAIPIQLAIRAGDGSGHGTVYQIPPDPPLQRWENQMLPLQRGESKLYTLKSGENQLSLLQEWGTGLPGFTEWKGSFDVTIYTGDGEAVFLLSARDEAGNVGREITGGGSFVVDTLIYADADEDSEVLCVSEPGTKMILPPGAIDQDLRIEIVKSASLAPGMIGVYDFIPYDPRMRKLRNLIFKIPVEITFPPEFEANNAMVGVYFWDGVKWHKIQDTWTDVRVDYPGRFALMESGSMDSGITHGWAAPNPFTPNGSGDATDRTIFHVATKYAEDFEVRIYDLNGRLVKCLEAGKRAWDGTDEDGRIVEGGLYIYQIHSGDQVISGTVVVLN